VLLDDSLACLEKAQRDGLIRAFGLSNVPPATVVDIATRFSISAFEGPLSLLSPVGTERLFRDVRVHGLKTLAYGPLAQGFLSGRYSAASTFEPTDRRSRLPHYSSASWRQHAPMLQTLAEVARETGHTPAQVAIRWVMDTGAASTVVFGARTPEQVVSSVGALGWALDAVQMRALFASRRRVLSAESDEQGGPIVADV
jgi:aryl-alcohol dehydrogenase-like predicted oxidoreductase